MEAVVRLPSTEKILPDPFPSLDDVKERTKTGGSIRTIHDDAIEIDNFIAEHVAVYQPGVV